MSAYAWLNVSESSDYDGLVDLIDEEYDPREVVARLKEAIAPAAAGVLIEAGYVDKDYRSTFYKYYAKKGRAYREDCIRLHFFDATVSFDSEAKDFGLEDQASPHGKSAVDQFEKLLAAHYFGYIVLRPTLRSTIGRSVLSPDIRVGAKGIAIQGKHHVHLMGYRLEFWGFPSMAQHADISVCAHVSCWSILRHYSERYSQHKEWLLHDITRMAMPFDPGGLAPSLGLYITEAERVFQAAGTFPLTVSKDNERDEGFYAQILAYLESGFPLFIALEEHAVVVVGHNWKSPAADRANFLSSHAWEQVESLLAVDDNELPYVRIPRDLPEPGEEHSNRQTAYSAVEFEAFIVALPEKIFYSAQEVEAYSSDALFSVLGLEFDLPEVDNLLRRYFVTTISSLRKFARENRSQLGDDLVDMLMDMRSAQFVWVVEYASTEQWTNGHIAARAIIDATASPQDPVPVIFAHGQNKALYFDRSQPSLTAIANELGRDAAVPLGRMDRNMRPVKVPTKDLSRKSEAGE